MLHKLTPAQYPNVRPVFEALRYNIVVDSVIDGNTPGWVFADDAERPTTAFIWDMQDAMLVAGDPGQADVNQALAALIPGARLETLAAAAHAPFLSDPADFVARVAAFCHEPTP